MANQGLAPSTFHNPASRRKGAEASSALDRMPFIGLLWLN
jgi:hypothetical protein